MGIPSHEADTLDEDEIAPGKELVTDAIEGAMLFLARGPETLKLLVR